VSQLDASAQIRSIAFTMAADVWDIDRACLRAADEGHDRVRVLGRHFDAREIVRLLDVAGIFARAKAGYLSGKDVLGAPHPVRLLLEGHILMARDDDGAFALAALDEPPDVDAVTVPAKPIVAANDTAPPARVGSARR
jgi:hypothetical protein